MVLHLACECRMIKSSTTMLRMLNLCFLLLLGIPNYFHFSETKSVSDVIDSWNWIPG